SCTSSVSTSRVSAMAEHIIAPKTYVLVFAALLALTYTTYAVAFIDLGPWNVVAALAIAVGKALLVALFFMHLRHSPRLTWVVAGGGLFWLGILLTLTVSDYLTRGWLAGSAGEAPGAGARPGGAPVGRLERFILLRFSYRPSPCRRSPPSTRLRTGVDTPRANGEKTLRARPVRAEPFDKLSAGAVAARTYNGAFAVAIG